MLGLFSRSVDQLTEHDLRDLAEVRRVREHIQLDYKQEAYTHNHDGAVEMLADVTAMANAQGGYILIGVEEDQTSGDGTPLRVIGIRNADVETRWIQSVCLSSIDEKIPGLRVHDVSLATELACVVIQVPNSVRKPHMVVHERHRSFRLRHGRDKSFMGMQEVRNMILSMESYRETLSEFLRERVGALVDAARGEPWLMLMTTPIYIDTDKIDPLRSDIRSALSQARGIPDGRLGGIHVGTAKPRVFGIEAVNPDTSMPLPLRKVLRLFRNGHLKYWESYRDYIPEGWPQRPMRLNSYGMTVKLLHFLETARQIYALGEVTDPITVTVHCENFNPSYLYRWPGPNASIFPDELFLWREPKLNIDLTVTDLTDPQVPARAIIDRLFNAFEHEDNPHFAADGSFISWPRGLEY